MYIYIDTMSLTDLLKSENIKYSVLNNMFYEEHFTK